MASRDGLARATRASPTPMQSANDAGPWVGPPRHAAAARDAGALMPGTGFAPPREAARVLDGRDLGLAALLFLGGLALYGHFALRLAEGRLYDYFNLAFDFDASRVLSMLTQAPPDGMGFKHPLMIALRPLGLALLALGLPEKQAAGMVMAGTGAGTLVLAFLFLRVSRIARPEALSLALLYAVSGTQIVTAIVTESYGFAGFSLALVWLVARLRQDAPHRFGALRYAAALLATGITFTNAMQPAIAEAAQAIRERLGWRGLLHRLIRFGLVCGLLFLACVLLFWGPTIWEALQDPVGTLKAIWWLQTQGEKTGPLPVLQTFLTFSFVSPGFTVVTLPEGTGMLDFRRFAFTPAGGVAVLFWLLFLAMGTAASLRDAGQRPIALGLLAALVANIVFHLGFQFRASLYIYAAHTHFLVFALSAGLALRLGGQPGLRAAYVAAVLALATLLGAVNLPMAADFATRFDVPDTTCAAPCK